MLAKRENLLPVFKVMRTAYFPGIVLKPLWNKALLVFPRVRSKSYPQKMWINSTEHFSSWNGRWQARDPDGFYASKDLPKITLSLWQAPSHQALSPSIQEQVEKLSTPS